MMGIGADSSRFAREVQQVVERPDEYGAGRGAALYRASAGCLTGPAVRMYLV